MVRSHCGCPYGSATGRRARQHNTRMPCFVPKTCASSGNRKVGDLQMQECNECKTDRESDTRTSSQTGYGPKPGGAWRKEQGRAVRQLARLITLRSLVQIQPLPVLIVPAMRVFVVGPRRTLPSASRRPIGFERVGSRRLTLVLTPTRPALSRSPRVGQKPSVIHRGSVTPRPGRDSRELRNQRATFLESRRGIRGG